MPFKKFSEQPIILNYQSPNATLIEELKTAAELCVIEPINGLHVDHTYFKSGYRGALPIMYTRRAILKRLHQIHQALLPDYGLFIYDVFRTRDTQQYLFDKFTADIHAKKPHLSPSELTREVLQYIAPPDNADKNYLPSHNSGGAVDLAIYRIKTNKVLDFGAAFDDTEVTSHLCFFEQSFNPTLGFSQERWETARAHRRVLFHLMQSQDFIALPTEWWHYDLGDYLWSQEFKLTWSYQSLENDVLQKFYHSVV